MPIVTVVKAIKKTLKAVNLRLLMAVLRPVFTAVNEFPEKTSFNCVFKYFKLTLVYCLIFTTNINLCYIVNFGNFQILSFTIVKILDLQL
jgi:hypothetical protein